MEGDVLVKMQVTDCVMDERCFQLSVQAMTVYKQFVC